MAPTIARQFEHLAIARSPENLSCDGELTKGQIRSKHTQIMKVWNALEAQIGRKVSLREIQNGMCGL